jgi:hypothetical protein
MTMYISRGLNPEPAAHTRYGTTALLKSSHQEHLQQLQQLIERSTASGRLDRQDEATILAALAKTPAYSVEKCELFRQLQERVWQAELYLDW